MAEKLKVVVTEYIEDNLDWEAEQLAERGIDFEAYQLKFKPEVEILEKIALADIIVVNMLEMGPALISKLDRCKLLIRHGIGYNNIDVPACTAKSIIFAYQPGYCQEDVAEHAIALIFALARQVPQSRKTLEQASQSGQWDFSELFPLYRMKGKKLGILGVGRIGGLVYRKLSSFGFDFIACDPYLSDQQRAKFDKITWVDRETLFGAADLLTLHVPLNDETRHIVNAESLGWMKPTAYLVNTARGPVVDCAALAQALREKRIAGAAVDVFDVEPPPTDFELFELENAVLTPHIAWASEESGQDIRERILEDILAFVDGGMARDVVNTELLQKG